MYNYIKEQPSVLRSILQNRVENTVAFQNAWKQQQPDRLYLIASGTSGNAAATAAPFMEEVLGVEVSVCVPTQLPPIRGVRPYLVFISQGGNSNNTIAAIETLSQYPSIVLTGSADSRMAEMFDYVLIACGEETAGPKTKGYTSTVLTLQLMALQAAGKEAQYLPALQTAVDNMPENITRTQQWLADNEKELLTIEKCFLAAHHHGLPIAQEASLKLLETMLIPASAFEFEEYLHGPICAMEEKLAGLYLMPQQEDARMQKLIEFHRTLATPVYKVGAQANDKRDCALLMTGQWYTTAYEWILPAQMMGAKLPVPMGISGRGHKVYVALSEALNVKFEGGA